WGEVLALLTSCGVPSGFQKLRVYQLAVALSDEIYEMVPHWPFHARKSFGYQLIRSADSIAANIAEATGRDWVTDCRRLLVIPRGSFHVAEQWMDRAARRGFLPLGAA